MSNLSLPCEVLGRRMILLNAATNHAALEIQSEAQRES
jgi:hypothetical protein